MHIAIIHYYNYQVKRFLKFLQFLKNKVSFLGGSTMKKQMIKGGIIAVLLLILPSISLIINSISGKIGDNQQENSLNNKDYIIELPPTYKLLIEEKKEVIELSPREYIKGCLFANIPAEYETEMLKAMAVVCNTYGLMLYKNRINFDSEKLYGADFSDNSSEYLKYHTPEKAKEVYGDEYEALEQRINEAAQFGVKYALIYKGELIMPAFHSISTGKTDNSKDIFDDKVPYLKSADSQNDLLSPSYYGSKKMESSSVRGALMRLNIDVMLSGEIKDWFTDIKRSDSSTVLSVKCGNMTFTGRELQRELGLRSASFEVVIEDDMFLFKTKGHGHNVGLSLYGGNFMAKSGASASDILTHYYNEVEAVVL